MTQHSGPIIAHRDNLTVIDCQACGFYHLDPLPDPDRLATFYQSEFWQHKKAGALHTMEVERPWWNAIYGDWLSLVEKYAKDVTLLDVGAGFGHFVKCATDNFWSACGVEPSEDALRNSVCKSRIAHSSFYNALVTLKDFIMLGAFNCISALWLIEHLPDPLEFISDVYDLLPAGGVLFAVVPNDFNRLQLEVERSQKAKSFYWLDETHLNYFTWESFERLLNRAGFRIVERSTLYPMERFLLRGDDYTRIDGMGEYCHSQVRHWDMLATREQRLRQYQDMASRGIGREIVIVAVKE